MKKLIFSSIFLMSFQFSFAGGLDVGNGGNVVQCAAKSKYLSLDYLLTKDSHEKYVKVVPAKNLNQSFQRILNLILQKLPKLHESFREFVEMVDNRDESKKYVWEVATYDLEMIQELDVQLPLMCRSNRGNTDILQAIIRKKPNSTGQIIFEYDEKILLKLKKEDPLQLSFLLVHEWLWNFVNEIEQLRKINYFLHSSLFEELPAPVVVRELGGFGFLDFEKL